MKTEPLQTELGVGEHEGGEEELVDRVHEYRGGLVHLVRHGLQNTSLVSGDQVAELLTWLQWSFARLYRSA